MTVSAEYNTKQLTTLNLAKTAGAAVAVGSEVRMGADNDKFALADDTDTGIGFATEDAALGSTARQDVRLLGSGAVVKVRGNGTVTAGSHAVSAGNGKLTNAGVAPNLRTLRGKFLETSAVDNALVMLCLQ